MANNETRNNDVNEDNSRVELQSENRVIPVIEEQIIVDKRVVETGRVRISKRVSEREELVDQILRHVVVNRQPVNRAVTEGDFGAFKEGDIEITEHSEEAVVSKQARVTEEVSIGKTVEDREQVVNETVRSTEVDVEEFDGDTKTRGANR